jgi:hypothetical protein
MTGLFSGCETGGDKNGLSITPSSVSSSNRTEGIVFTVDSGTNTTTESGVKELSLPLTWRTTNPLLGSITSSGGYSCTYVRNSSRGVQTIIVEDQYGSQGSATVNQL